MSDRIWVRHLLALCLMVATGSFPAFAQSSGDADLKALNERIIALYQVGKYAEALPQAQRYVEETKRRFGVNSPQHATALNHLAALFQATNRLAEAEPLVRRALAIDEESYGPDHPTV